MNNPLFSIITVCFNSEKTIERTIKSVLAQTYKDYEYIIVDGASKDSTVDIIKRYEPLFEGRMKWKSEPDRGIYNAMNKGIKRSCGEIIGIVNSDDWLESDTLQILVDEISKEENLRSKILTGNMLFHYKDGNTQLFNISYEMYEYYTKRYRMGLNHPATFVPRCVYDEHGIFDENYKLHADADFIIRCYKAGVGVHFIPKILSNMTDGGVSNTYSPLEKMDTIYKYKKYAKSKTEYYWLCYRERAFLFMKSITPSWYIKWYRKRHYK